MKALLIFAFQEMENSKAFQLGYEVGYFMGSNFWEVVSAAVIVLAAILYLAFFRKRKNNIG
ncbi:hypothetical protein [Salinimicrobium sp. HB62]|uniref:hypothetical protein n=1 Tax=Salinimicrobium sp. HB62 TaxID=3077781 RepID=UPI002D794240|nr:hypothetical protein [Salinimicrobium sp. HB62]